MPVFNLAQLVANVLMLCIVSHVFLTVSFAQSGSPIEKEINLGERMYRQGILPSGESMKAYVSGDVPVDGTFFTCESCHLRSGLGSYEGEVLTTPTNGRILYEPREPFIKGNEFVPYFHNYAVDIPPRAAYTDESLAAVITTGVDPNGRPLNNVMPKYEIEDEDMAVLIDYLKNLSNETPPGVSEEFIYFATVIVDGVSKKDIDSLMAPLDFGVGRKNSLAVAAAANDRVGRMGYNMLGPNLLKKKFRLSRWVLKGPVSSWEKQLDEYYAAEPVFALLGGITNGDWQPVHRFCEKNKVPNLLPITDYPVLSETDWYTIYFSRGIRQQGEAAARYVNSLKSLFEGRDVVQVVGTSRQSKALAQGFREEWQNLGQKNLKEMVFNEDDKGHELLAGKIEKDDTAVLLIWDGKSAAPMAENFLSRKDEKRIVISSGTLWGKEIYSLPTWMRNKIYFTYPYRLPQEDKRFDMNIMRVLPGKIVENFNPVIIRKAYIINEILGNTLMMMRGEYYRDFFFDTIGMMEDAYYPLYERIGFGPGQRYTSKGCFIVQLGSGENPQLERRSEWVTH